MSYSGLSGQYGALPYDIIRQKYERTAVYESPYAMEDHHRNILKDTGCDPTFFESDHKREDTHAEEFMSLRHECHRTGEIPDAPDMFLELTGRDPRGTQNDPILRNAAARLWEIRDSKKFYSDSDMSVTEREKRPQQLIAQIRDQFENIKARMKWFSTSKDFLPTSHAQRVENPGHGPVMFDTQDSIAKSREQQYATPRRSVTTDMSNLMPMGWEQTGDHEFKIAHYGQVRGIAPGAVDVELNRVDIDARPEARLMQYQDQLVTAGVANIMKTVVENRAKREADGEWLPTLTRQQTNSDYRTPMRPESGLTGQMDTQRDQLEQDAVKNMERFIGQLNRQSGMKNQDIETQLEIIKFMDSAVRRAHAGEPAHFSAKEIAESAQRAEGFRAARPSKAAALKSNPLQGRNLNESADRTDGMQIARLGRSDMTRFGDRVGRVLIGEAFKSQSHSRTTDKMRGPDIRNPYNTRAAPRNREHGTADRYVKGMGDKFTRDKMDNERSLNAIADSS